MSDEQIVPPYSSAHSTSDDPFDAPIDPDLPHVSHVDQSSVAEIPASTLVTSLAASPSSAPYQLLESPASHVSQPSYTSSQGGDSGTSQDHARRQSQQDSGTSQDHARRQSQHHRGQHVDTTTHAPPTNPTVTMHNEVMNNLRSAIEELTSRMSMRREQFHHRQVSNPEQQTGMHDSRPPQKISTQTALGFLLRPDRLAIDVDYARKLVAVYDLHTHHDLVEIVYNYSPKESLSFLDKHFSLDEFTRMKTLMINLVLFGRYLGNTYKIDNVPPLNEIRWRLVQRSMDSLSSSTTQDIVYQHDWLIRHPSAWLQPNSYTQPLPAPVSHPIETYVERHGQATPQSTPTNPSTTKTRNVQSVLDSMYGSLDPEGARRDVSSIARHVEGTNRGYTNASPRFSDHSFPGQRHSSASLPHVPSGIPPVTGSQSTNQMPGSYDNTNTSRQRSVPPHNASHGMRNPTLLQQHFNTPGAQANSNLSSHSNPSTKPKILKRNGFDATKIKWDGKIDTFPPVEAALRSYCMTAQMGYLVRPQFLRDYEIGMNTAHSTILDFHTNYVDDDGNSLTQLNISFDQLLVDCTALFGAIVGISRFQVATDIVRGFSNTNDGIAAFIALIERYGGLFVFAV